MLHVRGYLLQVTHTIADAIKMLSTLSGLLTGGSASSDPIGGSIAATSAGPMPTWAQERYATACAYSKCLSFDSILLTYHVLLAYVYWYS